MENISFTLELLLELKKIIESGHSVRQFMNKYYYSTKSIKPEDFIIYIDNLNNGTPISLTLKISHHRRALYNLIQKAVHGQSIYQQLVLLEEEVLSACQSEMSDYITLLPYKSMLPTLCFMLPAMLILLFDLFLTPILNQLGGHL